MKPGTNQSESAGPTWQQKARRWFFPLRYTPLHPQWLVLRQERDSMVSIAPFLSDKILDVGCADRRLRRYLPDNTRYVGLDYPVTATGLYDSRPDVFGDAQNLPFADGCIESVALLDVLEHLPDPQTSVAEIHRVLATGGVLALQVPFMYPLHDAPFDFHRWTRYGLRKLLQEHGFAILQEDFYGHPMETAALIANIALARTVAKLLEARNPLAVLLGLAAAVMIPLRNVSGWIFASLPLQDEIMPFGYRVVCRKGAARRE